MWKSKKFIIAAVLVAVLAAVGIGGVIMAADEDESESQGAVTETQQQAMLERVLEIYEEETGVVIEDEILRDAFAQARSERRDVRIQERLDRLVEEGVITQAEADEMLEWWNSKPDVDAGIGLGERIQNRIQERIQDCDGECDGDCDEECTREQTRQQVRECTQECVQEQFQVCDQECSQQQSQAKGNCGNGGK